MERCSKCLLPETYPNIRYNGDGVCNYCLSYIPIEYKGETELEKLLDTHRNRNKGEKYDCVVAVSGGRDSTFTLYELIEVYDMRVLAYNYDNGFVSEQAKLNLKRITDALGVDLVIIKHDQTKYFRNNLMALLKKFSPAMIPALCLGCRYFFLNSVGFTERNELLSNMISEGMISREEALRRLMDEYEKINEKIEKMLLGAS